MNKYTKAILSTPLLFFLAIISASCSNTLEKNNIMYNKSFNKTVMTSYDGNKINLKLNKTVIAEELGIAFLKPSLWHSFEDKSLVISTVIPTKSIYIDFLSRYSIDMFDAIKKMKKSSSIQYAQMEKMRAAGIEGVVPVVQIASYTKEENENLSIELYSFFNNVFELGFFADRYYYLCYNTEYQNKHFSKIDKKILSDIVNSLKEFESTVMLFPPQKDPKKSIVRNFKQFKTTDINGNTIDQNIFKNYALTMINIWGTSCSYCVEEMPYLEKLYQQLPENINLLSLCYDAVDNKEFVKKIIDEYNLSFTTLCESESLNKNYLNAVESFPTTIFVTNKGVILDTIQIGVPSAKEHIVESYNMLLKKALAEL